MTELPHTRTRTFHWAATAAALAAVLGLSGLLQPSDATANPASRAAASAKRAPDPAKAHYPLECGRTPAARTEVQDKGAADIDGDGVSETVAVVRCKAEGGTPPSAVYVLTPAAKKGGRPEIAATLVEQKERMTVRGLKVSGGTVAATLFGYSSPDVPRCCPDKQRKVKWEWQDGKFVLVPASVARSV